MKRHWNTFTILISFILVTGCYNQPVLEDSSITLMLGLDLDSENNLIVYHSSPVFNKDAKENMEIISVKAATLLDARAKLDTTLTGQVIAGKNQIMLISKAFLEHDKNWFKLLDIFRRDPKQSATPIVALYDGPLNEVFEYKPIDKPRLPIYLKTLIETSHCRNATVLTNIQDFYRQLAERGISPSITELKKEPKQIWVAGTALLNHKGEYSATLSTQKSSWLLLLQDKNKGDLPFSFVVPEAIENDNSVHHKISAVIRDGGMKVKTSSTRERFEFDVKLKLNITIAAVDVDYKVKQHKTELETLLTEEIKKQLNSLILDCQAQKTDPFGFGLYARAYEYSNWKQVQNNWEEAFSKAKVNVHPKVDIKSVGVLE